MRMYLINPEQITFDRANELVTKFNTILDKGYTYFTIRKEIERAYKYGQSDINWNCFNAIVAGNNNNRNLLKSGIRYYHKNLTLRGNVPVIEHDIDKGTLVSQETQFYVEPKASYTMKQLVQYFWDRTKVDQVQFPEDRVASFFTALLRSYDIDNLLFIIEAAGRSYEDTRRTFDFRNFVDFNPIALSFMNDIKQSCAESGGSGYVLRKRLLPL